MGLGAGSVVVDITAGIGFKGTGTSRNDGEPPTISGLNGGSEPPSRLADALWTARKVIHVMHLSSPVAARDRGSFTAIG